MADKVAPYGLTGLVTGQQAKLPADIGKIKSNIQRMIDQNAPEADIDAYVASEGMTPEQLRQRTAAVKKHGAGASVVQGVTFGFGDEVMAGGVAGLRSIYDPRTGEWMSGDVGKKYDEQLAYERQLLGDARAEHPYQSGALEAGGAMLSGGGLASGGVSLGANAVRSGASLGRTAMASGAEGALIGGAYGFGAGEGGAENRLEGAGKGAATGAVVGAAAPYVIAGASRLISPSVTSPERTAMANALGREGVDLTAGQRTGNQKLRYAESEIGGQRAANMAERQGEQFTAAALRRAGTDARRATPEAIDDILEQTDDRFRGLSDRNMLMPDQEMIDGLTGVQNQYSSLVPQNARASVIDDTINDIMQTINLNGPNGTPAIQGQSYQAVTSWLAAQARKTTNPEMKEALYGIREVLDDAMERSIAAANPRDLGAWRSARNLYRNYLVIEQAATGAGENAALGLISPSQLRNATVSKQGRRNYARGQGDFAELARAGEALMKPLPNSGTASRLATRLPAFAAGVGGLATGGLDAGLLAAGAAMLAPKAAGAAMMSGPGQRYLGNQVMQNLTPRARALVNALTVGGSVPAAERGKQSRLARRLLGAP